MGIIVGKVNIEGIDISGVKTFLVQDGNRLFIIKNKNYIITIPLSDNKTRFKKVPYSEWDNTLSSQELYYMEILLCLSIEKKIPIIKKKYTYQEIEKLIKRYYPPKCKLDEALMNIHKL